MVDEYDKLVRDDIPEIIEADGDEPVTHTVDGQKYCQRLHDKLDDEVGEFHESDGPEELADMLAVVAAFAEAYDISEDELDAMRRAKAAERGRFEEGIVLDAVHR